MDRLEDIHHAAQVSQYGEDYQQQQNEHEMSKESTITIQGTFREVSKVLYNDYWNATYKSREVWVGTGFMDLERMLVKFTCDFDKLDKFKKGDKVELAVRIITTVTKKGSRFTTIHGENIKSI